MSEVAHIIPEVPVARVPRTVRELVEYLALTAEPHWMYHCMQGQPRAYMEIWSDDGKAKILGKFVTLAYWSGGRREDVEARLVSTMWDVFVAARDEFAAKHCDHPLLFWRRMPAIEERHDIETGIWRTFLTCRVWVPGVDLSPHNREGLEAFNVRD
jgi:hypothetical protein